MKKKEFINMGYKQLNNYNDECVDTIYKKFESGRIFIVQFSEDNKEKQTGIVYVMEKQLKELLK